MNTVLFVIAAVSLLVLLMLSFMLRSVRRLWLLFLHSAAGWVGLYIWNSLFPALMLGINIASATILGILGIPGLFLMLAAKLLFKL
ncbi:MAG: pro-sigmaK processing inhibitor BofA family protein [Clostridia bacterium]|nr:pro-sigmaK processing inhibitor BofA family protein [Clostridia bacterium]